MKNSTIDLHCHPAAKPYSKSFKSKSTRGKNSTRSRQKNSIWHYDPPGFLERLANRVTGLTKFTQADLSTLTYGNVGIVCASFYPLEKGFTDLVGIKTGLISDFITSLISGFGKARIDYIQNIEDYFEDLNNIYSYYQQLDNTLVTVDGKKKKYILAKNYVHLEQCIAENEGSNVETVYIIVSIEGLHVLNTGLDKPADENEVLANLQKIKEWEHKPVFITFAHHFYNELCGHAESMPDKLQDLLTIQEPGMNEGFTPLGKKVLKKMLDDQSGHRLLTDIKHMSAKARYEYYDILASDFQEDFAMRKLPIIVSHGACNGLKSPDDPRPTTGLEKTSSRMFQADINFYDDEIVKIANSGGILGLQLDERRIASKRYMRSLRLTFGRRNKRMHSNSKMVWNNIQHILELLDKHDVFAWDCMAVGSDFDGIIDPINLFWSAEYMEDLIQFVERHAYNYMTNDSDRLRNDFNKIDSTEIVDRIFFSNAYEFFRKYY